MLTGVKKSATFPRHEILQHTDQEGHHARCNPTNYNQRRKDERVSGQSRGQLWRILQFRAGLPWREAGTLSGARLKLPSPRVRGKKLRPNNRFVKTTSALLRFAHFLLKMLAQAESCV